MNVQHNNTKQVGIEYVLAFINTDLPVQCTIGHNLLNRGNTQAAAWVLSQAVVLDTAPHSHHDTLLPAR